MTRPHVYDASLVELSAVLLRIQMPFGFFRNVSIVAAQPLHFHKV